METAATLESHSMKVSEPPVDATTRVGGYDPSFFDQLASVEEQHFWFRSRNRLIFEVSKRISSTLVPGYLVMEVGCGTGNVLRILRQAFPDGMVIGLELWFAGLQQARKRSTGPLVQGDIRQFPFSRRFDVIGMFDVLEHVDKEKETLASLWEVLTAGRSTFANGPRS